MNSILPVAVVGAGPVGLAAAARLVERGIAPVVFERGATAGAAVAAWGHVRVFSPWSYNVDEAARALLAPTGWRAPAPDALPTGAEIVRDYLAPLAAHPAIAPHLRLNATVTGIVRAGLDRMTTAGRDGAAFAVRWRDADGAEHTTLARAVIDASGTWERPNPMGVDGLPVPGEAAAAGRIAYGIPDVLGAGRASYAGATVLVVGSGHSAMNVVLDLLRLQDEAPGTRVLWALRRNRLDKLVGGGAADQLRERGALGLAARRAIDEGRLEVLAPFAAERIALEGGRVTVDGLVGGAARRLEVDRVVVATGFRPELGMLSELRVGLDPIMEAPPALAPLIDPNVHSCGTVPPHGAAELGHPEAGFYIVGMKSYGRAPTFLMATGYEQVRSVVAEIAGDHAAAREVRLVLPETGVCSATPASGAAACCGEAEPAKAAASCCGAAAEPVAAQAAASCCGGPAPAEAAACCVADAVARDEGKAGCGCGPAPAGRARDLVAAR